MENVLKVIGKENINGMEFTSIEGGFGENKKSMLAKEIANIHNRELKHINELINNNKKRFKTNVDIMDLKGTEFEVILNDHGIYNKNALNRSGNIYLLSERGYSKLLKLMGDDLAWDKFDELVDGYFEMRKDLKEYEHALLLERIYKGGQDGIIASKQLSELEKKPLIEENKHKKEVIQGLTDDISLQDKRSILNKVVKQGGNYKERYSLLYNTYKETYHIDLKIRFKNYNLKHSPKMKSIMEFSDKQLNAINELYGLACKLFESDIDKLIQEMYKVVK